MAEAGIQSLPDSLKLIGSASELEYLLTLGHDLELINRADFERLITETVEVKKMLITFFQKLKAAR